MEDYRNPRIMRIHGTWLFCGFIRSLKRERIASIVLVISFLSDSFILRLSLLVGSVSRSTRCSGSSYQYTFILLFFYVRKTGTSIPTMSNLS